MSYGKINISGSTAKELVNTTGTKLADLEKKGSGKVSVVDGLGNTPPEKVLQGSIYSDEGGVRRTGTMEDITPDLNTQSDLIKEIRAMLVGRVTEANATPEDILKGKKAYVGEKLVIGVLEPVNVAKLFGYTKVAVSEFVFPSRNEVITPTFTHSLGVIPKFFFLLSESEQISKNDIRGACFMGKGGEVSSSGSGPVNLFEDYNTAENEYVTREINASINASSIKLSYYTPSTGSMKFYFAAGVPYTLITMA